MPVHGHGGQYLDTDDVSRTLAVLGFYISVISLASYVLKERLYLSEPLVCTLIGIATGPVAWALVDPLDWVSGDVEIRNQVTFQIVRIVIGIQVLFTGISLPKAYLRHAWKSLTWLLLFVMTCAWLVSAGFIKALLPQLTFLESLIIAACVTPTDPVLANSVVKGRFAEKRISAPVRRLIAAESGANDGLGFPFIYLAIYIALRFDNRMSIGQEIGWWIVDIWIYDIVLSVVSGAIIGYIARKAVKYAEEKGLIDHESFLAIGIGLTFLTLGLEGLLGSDDILACFIVGNSFTWDDYFRVRTEDDSFQDTIDSLINVGVFIYIGAILPWSAFGEAGVWRLVVIATLILLFRRLPWVMMCHRFMPELKGNRQDAIFTGWFGPIGVSAIYYVIVGLESVPEDRANLRQLLEPVVYFMILASIVVHGISVPILEHGRAAAKVTRSWSIQPRGDDLSTKFQYRNSGSARSSVRDIHASDTALVNPSTVRSPPSTPTQISGPQFAAGDVRVAFAEP